jgi:hypothetical protein
MSFPANGGTDSVAVTVPAGFNWSAQSNDAWIRITSGGNGLGPGEVSYTVDPRNDPQSTTTNRSGTITIAGSTFTVAQGVAFTDVDPTDPFYNEIGKLSARGVTLGCGGGQYCDTLNVNREQMAAFIIRAVGLPNPPAPPFQRFMDVSPLSPFYRVIDQMDVKQITLGCGGNNYCPTELVTHGQMAAFIIRARGEFNPPSPSMSSFSDVDEITGFIPFIERMYQLQIWTGCGANPLRYCPGNPVTRPQMAAILVRAFNL